MPSQKNGIVLFCNAEVAQLVEQLICNQQVAGSSPIFGSILLIYSTLEFNFLFASDRITLQKKWADGRVVKGDRL